MHRLFAALSNHHRALRSSVLALLLIGFANANAQPAVANDSAVHNCQFLSTIEGSSGYGKQQDWRGVAKAVALRHAEAIGASHVVWERLNPVGSFNGVAIGRAYHCKPY